MELLKIHNETRKLTLNAGEQKHLVLLDPENVSLEIEQHEGSSLVLHTVSLDGKDSLVDVTINQVESHCETRLYGLALLQNKQQLTVNTHVYHSVGGGKSDQLIKFLVQDEAVGSFYGELKVQPDAQQTEAHQTNRNILLSPTARMNTKPQLEIYADDVKCSHGATTGQLDSNALFYMQQRGIPLHEAKRLLLSAFLADTLTDLPDDLRDNLEQTISETLH